MMIRMDFWMNNPKIFNFNRNIRVEKIKINDNYLIFFLRLFVFFLNLYFWQGN